MVFADDESSFARLFRKTTRTWDGECYISHIIFEMMLSGSTFYGTKTTDFKDWEHLMLGTNTSHNTNVYL